MSDQKLESILKAMDGITYLEWDKLKMSIDSYFKREASKQNRDIPLTCDNQIEKEYMYYSSTI